MIDQKEERQARDEFADNYEGKYLQKGKLYDWVEKKAIMGVLDLQPDDVVLDAGCGTGRLTRVIAKKCRKVYGVDFSPKSIDVLNRRLQEEDIHNVVAMVGDLTGPLPIDEPIDKIISIQVIQHIPTEAARFQTVDNLYRHLKVGGRLVFSVYNAGRLFHSRITNDGKFPTGVYFHRFIPEELETISQHSCFKEYSVKGCVNFRWYSFINHRYSYWLLYPVAWIDIILSMFRLSCYSGTYLIYRGIK